MKESTILVVNAITRQFKRAILKKQKVSIHKGVSYSCGQCDYKETQNGSLKIHFESIHKGVLYSCD